MVYPSSHVWMWELDYKESWVLKNWCFWTAMLEKTLESPLDCKETQPVHSKGNQSWIFIGRTDVKAETPILLATWCEELTHWKRPWCWERLGAGGEGDDRGRDGWMASPTQWAWVWVNSGSWWWTGRPSMLQSMGSQSRTLSDWTELNILTCPQSCLTLCDPVDCNSPGFSVHGILQVRILQWVAMPSSRGSSWPRDRTCISCIGRQILYHWATFEAPITYV